MTEQEQNWRNALLSHDSLIQDAIVILNKFGGKIALVTNDQGKFEGTISDGDIRRGLLKGLSIKSPITEIIHHNAIVVPPNISRELVLQLMVANKIQQIPVINESGEIVGLYLWDEISTPPEVKNVMVIMAGGMGARLRPETNNCPKPMLEVAGRPILEHIIDRARNNGFAHFIISVHYLGDMIKNYFGNGEKWDVEISYVEETRPLGTAGALKLLNPVPGSSFIVTNGDVITDINYLELLEFHTKHRAEATMAVRSHEWQHPYGIVHTQGIAITGFDEKPVTTNYINAGVYALEPAALDIMTPGETYDMPRIFDLLREKGKSTVAYPMHEPWLDVGRPHDLEQARNSNQD